MITNFGARLLRCARNDKPCFFHLISSFFHLPISMIASLKRTLLLTPFLLLAALALQPLPTGHAQTGSGTTVMVHVRNASQILYEGSVTLSDSPMTIVDNQGTSRSIAGKSALAALATADNLSTSFNITDLVYYPSFSSLYVNCIQAGSVFCGQWQYMVNDASPFVGIDQKTMGSGDDLYLFFGQPNRLIPSAPMVVAGSPFSVLAEKYDYKTNTFSPRMGVTVGVTKPNPADPYTPIVLSSAAVDGTGKAILTITGDGTYQLGVTEDSYYPSVDVRVVNPGSGGGGATLLSVSTTIPPPGVTSRPIGGLPKEGLVQRDPSAAFLITGQKSDGSIENALVSDWAAIALAGQLGVDAERERLKNYIVAHPETVLFTTDLERRAMALMALGVDPFHGTGQNYIVAIVRSFSKGQFGDAMLLNDDIFGLIPVVRAGIVKTSYRVKKVVDSILSKQASDGSWENPDLTAAAIQALLLADNDPRIPDAVRRGRGYLRMKQGSDGRIGMNSFSTSWASQALTGTGSTLEDQAASQKAWKYVESKIATDGGVRDGEDSLFNRLWGTSYALAAKGGKHWGELLPAFSPRKY